MTPKIVHVQRIAKDMGSVIFVKNTTTPVTVRLAVRRWLSPVSNNLLNMDDPALTS